MPKPTYRMTDPFEVDGTFWLPNQTEKSIAGKLKYSPDDIVLNLNGDLENIPTRDIFVGRDAFGKIPCVHGELDDGQLCTLLRVQVTGRTSNMRQTTRSRCSAIFLIIGQHTDSLGDLRIHELSVDLVHLNSFVFQQWFEVQQEGGSQADFKSLTVNYKQPDKKHFYVQSIATTLTIQPSLSQHETRTSVALNASQTLEIAPDEPKGLEWFIGTLWNFCKLLNLLTDERVAPTQLRFSQTGLTPDGCILYQAIQATENEEDAYLLLFYMKHLESQFSDILDRWFGFNETMGESIALYMDAVRRKGTPPHRRFGMLAEAVEAFSRATTASEYMLKAEYDKVINILNIAIPETVGAGHRASLKNKIKYGNEYSLRKRVELLLDSLSQEGRSLCCSNPADFITGFTETRNYLAHRTDELREVALDGADLYWACEKVLVLLRILFLKELGIPEAMVVERIGGHHRLNQIAELSKAHPERITAAN